ncbi:MAG: helix-hairpin-helix domain-containing protein, partial [Acidobacteriota bacterium]
AKVAVLSRERDVDPVGACVGMKGSRVQSIIRELRGEKIDIIEYSDDLVTFAQSALAPAKITRVSVTNPGETPHLDVIVEDEQLSLAIGKRGQNVRLAAELIGAKIDIKSETDVKDEVAGALAQLLQVGESTFDLTAVDGVDEGLAAALGEAGYDTQEAVAAADAESLQSIEGVTPEIAEALLAYAAEDAEEATVEAASDDEGDGGTMGDMDFMAALSKAFQESESESESGEEE